MAGVHGHRIGVLMIGSLYWSKRKHRIEWRDDHLDVSAAKLVKVPIRYGRRSGSRECTYTMVFSTRLIEKRKWGQGMVVPCKSQDLIREAECLWRAETATGKNPECVISRDWGCVSVVENPDNPMPKKMRNAWIERVKLERCYVHLNSATGEEVAVDSRGFLQIPWPKLAGEGGVSVDVLLATATNPSIVEGEYGSVEEIADAWTTPRGKREAKYFWNNTNERIKTFQDQEIEQRLATQGLHRPD